MKITRVYAAVIVVAVLMAVAIIVLISHRHEEHGATSARNQCRDAVQNGFRGRNLFTVTLHDDAQVMPRADKPGWRVTGTGVFSFPNSERTRDMTYTCDTDAEGVPVDIQSSGDLGSA